MSTRRLALMLVFTVLVTSGCASTGRERDRNDNAFTLDDSNDWGDAAGRVVNHLLAPTPPAGGIWPAAENR